MAPRSPRRPKAALKLGIALAISVLLAATGLLPFASSQTASAATPSTIFGAANSASWVLSSDRAATELGTVFRPVVAGKVTAIRFYKVAGVKGKHTGALWTKSGKKLAKVTFKKETASGWQIAKLAKAVKLKAGTTYVVSYHVKKKGRYAVNASGTWQLGSSASLTALKGVYAHKNKVVFPKKTSRVGPYPVDVVFTANTTSAAAVTPTPKPSVTPTPTPTPSVTPAPTTPTPKPSVTASPTSSAGSPVSAASASFPTRTSVGLPSGWVPKKVVSGDYTISTAGVVVEDLQVTDGTIYVKANNVTLRRVQGRGAFVKTDPGSTCFSGLVVEDSEFVKNGKTSDADPPVIGQGGFTVRRTVIDGLPEGIRAGGSDIGCGPITVDNTYVRVLSPDSCTDWHGDGLQGYGGAKVTVRRSTFIMSVVNNCYGTAPFFYPSGQGNTAVDIDGMLVSGGGYPFRNGMPGTVKNLNVVDGSWVYGPVDVNCSALSAWQAQTVKLGSDGSTTPVRSIACTGQGN
jgi:hypothetical protein